MNREATNVVHKRPELFRNLRPSELADSFAGRMMPMAGVAGVIVALLPPLLYGLMSWERLDRQAEVHAKHMASALSQVARQQPYLWMYNAHKVVEATASHQTIQELGAARIVGCDGHTLFSSQELGLGSGGVDGPVGWAPIYGPGRTVAWVQVTMDSHPQVIRTRTMGAGSLLVGLLLGGALFLLPTRVVRRQAKQLERTLGQLEQTEADLKKANHALQTRVNDATHELRQLSRRVVSIQEEERRRIARDLHDGLGQMLTAMRLDLERPNGADGVLELNHIALTELRRVVRDLRPIELEMAPFDEVLRHYTERFEERTGIPTSFRVQGPMTFDNETAVCILRVVQEALTNVSRHAQAHEVGISLTSEEQGVTLEISDDGVGFKTNTSSEGLGLRSMRERFRFLGGTLSIVSTPETGTLIRGHIPEPIHVKFEG
ncbi:MAG: sensor histidine kinase [Myxococcota bacterium]